MLLPVLALLLVQLNFGLLPVAQKTALTRLTPWSLFGLRTLLGALCFLAIYGLWRSLKRPTLETAEAVVPRRVFFALAFLGISANQFLLIVALTMTSSMAVVIMVPSITLFTFFLALVLGRESFSWAQAGTLLLGAGGVLILFADGLGDLLHGLDARALLGNFLCLSSAFVYALYLVLSRDWSGRLPALQFTSRMFLYSLVWTLVFLGCGLLWHLGGGAPLAAFFVRTQTEALPGIGLIPSWPLLGATLSFIVLGPTVLNYFLNFWVMRSMSASTVSGFISLQTLIGVTVSWFVLDEEIKPSYGVAAVCILCSILLLSWQSLRRKRQTADAPQNYADGWSRSESRAKSAAEVSDGKVQT